MKCSPLQRQVLLRMWWWLLRFITMVKKQYTDVRKSVYCFLGYYIRTCTIYNIPTNRDFFNIRTFTIYGLAFRTWQYTDVTDVYNIRTCWNVRILLTSVYCKHPYIVDVRILLKSVVCEHPYIVKKTSVPRYISYPYFEKNEIRISYHGRPYMVHESDPYIVGLTSVQGIIANPYRVIINIRTTYNTMSVLRQMNVRI